MAGLSHTDQVNPVNDVYQVLLTTVNGYAGFIPLVQK